MSVELKRAGGTAEVRWSPVSAEANTARLGPSLLPAPREGGLDGVQDAMGMMYELVSQQGKLSLSAGETSIAGATRDQNAEIDRERAALQKEEAAEAAANAGGFWADLESLAPKIAEYVGIAVAVVAAAAATVFTCGAAGVAIAAVAVALSATGMVVAKTGCLGKYSGLIGAGLEMVGSVMTCGATAGMAASSAVETAVMVGGMVSGGASVVAGVATVVTGNEQADVLDDTADVQQAMQLINRDARLMNDLVAGLKDTQQSNRNALKILAGAAQTYNQSLTLAAAGKA